MKARLTLKPGSKGAKKLTEQYGESLLYVRYRYDEKRKKRFKTVEIIVEEKNWIPKPPETAENSPENRIAFLRIGFGEKDLQEKIRKAGGKWNSNRKLWEIAYEKIPEGLAGRVAEVKMPPDPGINDL